MAFVGLTRFNVRAHAVVLCHPEHRYRTPHTRHRGDAVLDEGVPFGEIPHRSLVRPELCERCLEPLRENSSVESLCFT